MSDQERSAMQQALEALELLQNAIYNIGGEHVTGLDYANYAADSAEKPITALRAAQAQQAEPVQEPEGYFSVNDYGRWEENESGYGTPFYSTPPQRPPLTDEEITDAVREADLDWQAGWTLDEHEPNRFTTLARAIERKVRGE